MKSLETARPAEEQQDTSRKLLGLFVLGGLTVILGLVLISLALLLQGGSTNVGGVIFIGPIPIVFGTGPDAQWMTMFAVILAVLTVAMFLALRTKKGDRNP